MIQLRDYQEEILFRSLEELNLGRRTLVVSPTGSGKTVMFSSLVAHRLPELGVKRVVILIHNNKLIRQISETLSRMNVYHGVAAPANTLRKVISNNLNKRVGMYVTGTAVTNIIIMSVQSYKRFGDILEQAELIIIDECAHLTIANTWGRALDSSGKHLLLGFTATPIRSDKKEMGEVFDVMIQVVDMPKLISEGSLVPFRLYSCPSDIDMSGLRIGSDGDYTAKSIGESNISKVIKADAITVYKEKCVGSKIIAFCSSIEVCEMFADEFNAAGIPSGVLHSKMAEEDFEKTERDFRRGVINVVFNVAIFSEGYDAPEIDGVFLLSPTVSVAKFHQCIGRALRPHPGKSHASIYDFVGITQSYLNPDGLPLPTVKVDWSLYEHEERKKTVREEISANCTSCLALMPPKVKRCPYCESEQERLYEKRISSQFYRVDGELIEITTDETQTALLTLAMRVKPMVHFPKLPPHVVGKIQRDNLKLVEKLIRLKVALNKYENAGHSFENLIEYTGYKILDLVNLKSSQLDEPTLKLEEFLNDNFTE